MVTTSQDKVFIRATIDKLVNSMSDEECRVLLVTLIYYIVWKTGQDKIEIKFVKKRPCRIIDYLF